MDAPPRPKIRVRIKPKAPPTDAASFLQAVEDTLRQKVSEAATANLTGGLLICGLSLIAAFVTYWVAFTLLTWPLGVLVKLPMGLKSFLALAVLVGLFWLHRRTQVEALSELQVATPDGGPVVSFYLPQVGLVSNVAVFAPETMRSFVKLVAAIWLVSPQLMSAGWANLKRASRLRQMDLPGCAAVIAMLLGKSKKVAFAEIIASSPHLDLCGIAAQLANLDGVIFLREEPPGITLAADLRQDFLAGVGLSQ
jgi:hypothetical protein